VLAANNKGTFFLQQPLAKNLATLHFLYMSVDNSLITYETRLSPKDHAKDFIAKYSRVAQQLNPSLGNQAQLRGAINLELQVHKINLQIAKQQRAKIGPQI
jgi:hypothetical protein